MTPDELKAHARRIPEELLTQGDFAVADELLATNVEEVKGWVRVLRRAFPDLRAIVEDEIAEGDRVAQRLTLSGTHAGEFLGILPTGRSVTWQLVAIQRLGRDGKFAEHWSSPDLCGLLRQLGALSAPCLEVDERAHSNT